MALDPKTVEVLANIAVADGPEVIAFIQSIYSNAVLRGDMTKEQALAIWDTAHNDWLDAETAWTAAGTGG